MIGSRADIRDARYPGASLLGAEEAEAVARVMRSGDLFRYYGFGEPGEVAAYEAEWAAHVGVRHALAVNSGTSALFCALAAVGVGPGDEVVLPAFAWSSDANVVLQLGAIPVVVDIDETLTLDPGAVERALTDRTAAILPVHMRGAPSSLPALESLGAAAGVPVVEDACQAAGALLDGRRVGSFGRASAFSTQFAKVVSTGEGGMLVTGDADLHARALDVHDPGAPLRRGAEPSEYPALNLRCSELQAAVGRVQLRRVDDLVARTRRYAERITDAVRARGDLSLRRLVSGGQDNGIAVIFFAASGPRARDLRDGLRDAGVSASVLYEPGVPDLHVAPAWRPVHAALARSGRPQPQVAASLELLERAVQIDVHPLFDDDDTAAVCAAVEALS